MATIPVVSYNLRPRTAKGGRSTGKTGQKRSLTTGAIKVQLEKVLGLTVTNNSALDTDLISGTIAYPAGCVVVLYNPKTGKQNHIINVSKKTITAAAFSKDGKHLVTGEYGYHPAVRVWELNNYTQVVEFVEHSFGINCVAFSPNDKYVISVGSQHDMMVYVWNWRAKPKDRRLASNRAAANVYDVDFSEDGSYFVTVGKQHVRFWFLNENRTNNNTVPLTGKSAILGEKITNCFCAVACGKASHAKKTYVITTRGLLFEFNENRKISKTIKVKTRSSSSIAVSDQYIYIGCGNGTVHVLSCDTLQDIACLPKPHQVGVDVTMQPHTSESVITSDGVKYPDLIAISYDRRSQLLTCIYKDNSLYLWDVTDINHVIKYKSYLYHSDSIWGIDMYPALDTSLLPEGSFITCSSDDTIRVWNLNDNIGTSEKNSFSDELLNIIYSNSDTTSHHSNGINDNSTNKGISCVKLSPDGQHLAMGDKQGNIHIYDVKSMKKCYHMSKAHDSEVTALEYTKDYPDGDMLATADKHRVIRIFDRDKDYILIQTLDDHAGAVNGLKFTYHNQQLQLFSCSADRSLLCRRVTKHSDHVKFSIFRQQQILYTFYDMIVDPEQKFVVTASHDRHIRTFSTTSGKQERCFPATVANEGTLDHVQLDNSGSYVVTSCSDKTICLLDFITGEVLNTMCGHSEKVTGVKFTNDFKRIISVSGDGCVFVWSLPIEVTEKALQRASKLRGNTLVVNGDKHTDDQHERNVPDVNGDSSDQKPVVATFEDTITTQLNKDDTDDEEQLNNMGHAVLDNNANTVVQYKGQDDQITTEVPFPESLSVPSDNNIDLNTVELCCDEGSSVDPVTDNSTDDIEGSVMGADTVSTGSQDSQVNTNIRWVERIQHASIDVLTDGQEDIDPLLEPLHVHTDNIDGPNTSSISELQDHDNDIKSYTNLCEEYINGAEKGVVGSEDTTDNNNRSKADPISVTTGNNESSLAKPTSLINICSPCDVCHSSEVKSIWLRCCYVNTNTAEMKCDFRVHQNCIHLYYPTVDSLLKVPFFCPKHKPL